MFAHRKYVRIFFELLVNSFNKVIEPGRFVCLLYIYEKSLRNLEIYLNLLASFDC